MARSPMQCVEFVAMRAKAKPNTSLQRPSAAVELKRCATRSKDMTMKDCEVVNAFVEHLRVHGYPDLKVDRRPDKENRDSSDIDVWLMKVSTL